MDRSFSNLFTIECESCATSNADIYTVAWSKYGNLAMTWGWDMGDEH
jgi:hypothetical protein